MYVILEHKHSYILLACIFLQLKSHLRLRSYHWKPIPQVSSRFNLCIANKEGYSSANILK